MTTVTITLEFESDDISDAEVYNYLQELMDDGSLSWTEEVDDE